MSRVNVDVIAFTDSRFAHLATLLGLADADHARSKVEYLWWECTLRGVIELPKWVVEAKLGTNGPQALVDAQLARWSTGRGDSPTRLMHICGAQERCLWMARKEEQSSKGGKARASSASRAGGKFTSRTPATAGGVAPAQTSAPTPTPTPTPSERESREEPLPPEQTETATPPPLAISTRPENNLATPTPIHAATLDERQAARSRRWSELEQIRTRVAAKLGVKIRPLPPHDAGERELSSRILEAHTLERFEADCAHVFAVAEAQAIANREMRFLGGTLFKPGSWSTSLAMTMQEAQRPRRDIREQQPTYVCALGDDEQEAS